MNFLRQIALCYDKIGVTNTHYSHILNDLMVGSISNYKDAALKYYDGNEQSMYKAADRIKKEFYNQALDFESYHNEAQRIVMEIRIKSVSVHKLLSMGLRTVAIETALHIYKVSIKYHIFDIAADMAFILSQHYGQHLGNEKSCELWFGEYKKAQKQREITNEARYKYAIITSSFRFNKSDNPVNLIYLKEVVQNLSLYKDEAESYIYWKYYYSLKIHFHEFRKEYSEMLNTAKIAYEYFSKLPIDHKSSKLIFIGNVVHAYNLAGNFKRASNYEKIIFDFKDAGTNKDLALLRLSKSYINLGQEDKALELLNSIKGSLTDVSEKIDLYKSYCTGTHPTPPKKEDPHGMDIAYKIATLYCDILSGETDRYTHNYILKYIRRHGIGETREGVMLKILSIMRHRDYDAKKFKRYHYLKEVLSKSTSSLTEIEIMQYETMLDKIDVHYQN